MEIAHETDPRTETRIYIYIYIDSSRLEIFPTLSFVCRLSIRSKKIVFVVACVITSDNDDDMCVCVCNEDGIFSGALQITGSDVNDQGKYECVANNSVGTEYSKSAMLYVKGWYLPSVLHSNRRSPPFLRGKNPCNARFAALNPPPLLPLFPFSHEN